MRRPSPDGRRFRLRGRTTYLSYPKRVYYIYDTRIVGRYMMVVRSVFATRRRQAIKDVGYPLPERRSPKDVS